MRTRFSYAFEELTDELLRPPKAALRALLSAGIMLGPKGWSALDKDSRQALAVAGMHEHINTVMVSELVGPAGPANIKLVPRLVDPSRSEVPEPVIRSLGLTRTISVEEWSALSALDRYVIDSLGNNARLLWRAVEEIARLPGSPLRLAATRPWSGALARCEVFVHPEAQKRLGQTAFLGGRAMLLARAAGVRAARKAARVFDLQAETGTGPIELDWDVKPSTNVMLWQGHVSTWEGEFYPAAALLAVTAAAIAVYDMCKDLDPQATIGGAGIAEEPWRVGQPHEDREEATSVFVQGRS
jgi:cyclic pyranopterin phosphate synthase